MPDVYVPRHQRNAKDQSFAGPCPRCQGGVPNSLHPGKYPGALSRWDNETYICSACGAMEAMYQMTHSGNLPGFSTPLT